MAAPTVRDIMTTDVLTFGPEDAVRDAMEAMVERDVDGAPVVDEAGMVVGVLTNGDLIVRESKLHFPTLVSILGASFEIKHKDFDEDLGKALGSFVREVMTQPARTCSVDASIEEAATVMHAHDGARLPGVDADGRLIGLVSRGDIIRGMLGAG
jgi:CBS domain-containing protein